MNSLLVVLVASLIIIVAIVLYFAHVLGFDGSLLVSIGAFFIASLSAGRIGDQSVGRP
jgi:hypothetical protein